MPVNLLSNLTCRLLHLWHSLLMFSYVTQSASAHLPPDGCPASGTPATCFAAPHWTASLTGTTPIYATEHVRGMLCRIRIDFFCGTGVEDASLLNLLLVCPLATELVSFFALLQYLLHPDSRAGSPGSTAMVQYTISPVLEWNDRILLVLISSRGRSMAHCREKSTFWRVSLLRPLSFSATLFHPLLPLLSGHGSPARPVPCHGPVPRSCHRVSLQEDIAAFATSDGGHMAPPFLRLGALCQSRSSGLSICHRGECAVSGRSWRSHHC